MPCGTGGLLDGRPQALQPSGEGEDRECWRIGDFAARERLAGSLRALGDFSYKTAEWRPVTEQMVSPEPEVSAVERSPADEFLVLACDGVWDTVTNEELCAFIHSRLRVCTDLREVCSQVIDLCLYKVSKNRRFVQFLLKPLQSLFSQCSFGTFLNVL